MFFPHFISPVNDTDKHLVVVFLIFKNYFIVQVQLSAFTPTLSPQNTLFLIHLQIMFLQIAICPFYEHIYFHISEINDTLFCLPHFLVNIQSHFLIASKTL